MNKKQIAKNILSRADSTLYFLEYTLKYAGIKADDTTWQRSILIMISYAFELILKSEIVFTSKKTNADDIDKELRYFGHDIQKIICELNKRKSLLPMNIIGYQVNNKLGFKKYTITFEDRKEVIVEDFVDIRYDYTKTALRNITTHNIVIGYVDKILELSKSVNEREGRV